MAKKRRKTSTTAKVQKYLKSNSLARKIRKTKRKVVSKAKKTKRKLVSKAKRTQRKLKRLSRSVAKTRRILTKKSARAIKAARKAARRRSRESKREKKKRQSEARKQAREAARARVRQEIRGAVDISGANVVQASEDRGASRPGEPPKMRSGKGRSSIKAELFKRSNRLASRVFVDKKIAKYMAMWEFRQDGEGRPFLKPSLMNNLNTIGRVIGSELMQVNRRGNKKKASVK